MFFHHLIQIGFLCFIIVGYSSLLPITFRVILRCLGNHTTHSMTHSVPVKQHWTCQQMTHKNLLKSMLSAQQNKLPHIHRTCCIPRSNTYCITRSNMTQQAMKTSSYLIYWGWVLHICINNLTIIGPDDGLLPDRHQAIIWTNAVILLIQTLGTNLSEILSEIHTFSLNKMCLNMSPGKWWQFYLGLNVLSEKYITLLLILVCSGWTRSLP